MMRLSPIQAGLGAAIVAAMAYFAVTIGWPRDGTVDDVPSRPVSRTATSPAQAPASDAAAAPRLEPDGLVRAIGERPLFEPTRRRREAPQAVAPTAPLAPANVPPLSGSARLVGIVASELRNYAVIQLANAPRAVRVGEGEIVQGWTVERIGRDRLFLRAGDRQDELKFPERSRARASR